MSLKFIALFSGRGGGGPFRIRGCTVIKKDGTAVEDLSIGGNYELQELYDHVRRFANNEN